MMGERRVMHFFNEIDVKETLRVAKPTSREGSENKKAAPQRRPRKMQSGLIRR